MQWVLYQRKQKAKSPNNSSEEYRIRKELARRYSGIEFRFSITIDDAPANNIVSVAAPHPT